MKPSRAGYFHAAAVLPKMNRLGLGLFTRANAKHLLRFISRESYAVKEQVEKPRYWLPTAARLRNTVQENDDNPTISMVPSHGIMNYVARDNENEYIYKYIHSRLYDRFYGIEQRVLSLPVHQYIEKLKELVKEDPKNEEQIDNISAEIKSQIQYMNQLELTALLSSLKDQPDAEFKHIIRLIDMELRWLLKKHVRTRLMDLDLWLYVADLFYECRIRSRFTQVLVNYLTNEPGVEMTNRQVLHLLFLVVLRRQQGDLLEKYEARIFKLLNKATFEDLAIICMAYFKTKTMIKNSELLRRIIDLTADHLGTLDPLQPGYCSIVKSIRYSRVASCRDSVMHMVLSLMEDTNRRIIFASPYNAVHTIKLMESYRIYDPKILDMFRRAMFQDLNEFRIKDIQYALTSLSNLAYMDLNPDESLKNDFKKLVTQIVNENREDVDHQHYHLLPIVRAFAIFNYYDDELIAYTNKVLADPELVMRMQSVLEFDKSTLLAYVATHIEGGKEKLRDSTGILKHICNRIERYATLAPIRRDSSLAYLNFLLRGQAPSNSMQNSKLFHKIGKDLSNTETLKDLGYKFYFQHTFPHQNYNDLMITRSDREIGSFHPYSLLPRYVPKDDKTCMVYATQRNDFLDGHSRLSGYKQTMIRMATKLGYNVLTVDIHQPNIDMLARQVKASIDTH